MSNQIFDRYSRQIFIEEIGIEGQKKLLNSKVLIIGAGGLGSPVIQYLAAAGVGHIGIVDFDCVEIHNLNRQVIYNEWDIGKKKVNCVKDYISKFNPNIEIISIDNMINKENINQILPLYDIIVDGSDNFETRYLINDTCVKYQKPLVYGSIFHFEGQVAVFNYRGSKNLRNLFPTPPTNANTCDKFGVLGALPGIVGSLMAMNVLKIACNLPVSTNQLLIIDTINWNFLPIKF